MLSNAVTSSSPLPAHFNPWWTFLSYTGCEVREFCMWPFPQSLPETDAVTLSHRHPGASAQVTSHHLHHTLPSPLHSGFQQDLLFTSWSPAMSQEHRQLGTGVGCRLCRRTAVRMQTDHAPQWLFDKKLEEEKKDFRWGRNLCPFLHPNRWKRCVESVLKCRHGFFTLDPDTGQTVFHAAPWLYQPNSAIIHYSKNASLVWSAATPLHIGWHGAISRLGARTQPCPS